MKKTPGTATVGPTAEKTSARARPPRWAPRPPPRRPPATPPPARNRLTHVHRHRRAGPVLYGPTCHLPAPPRGRARGSCGGVAFATLTALLRRGIPFSKIRSASLSGLMASAGLHHSPPSSSPSRIFHRSHERPASRSSPPRFRSPDRAGAS